MPPRHPLGRVGGGPRGAARPAVGAARARGCAARWRRGALSCTPPVCAHARACEHILARARGGFPRTPPPPRPPPAHAAPAAPRAWRIFSIDPVTARDLDDALSIERLPDGAASPGGGGGGGGGEGEESGAARERWRVGVHIADVASFVAPGSALDREAALRGTSTCGGARVASRRARGVGGPTAGHEHVRRGARCLAARARARGVGSDRPARRPIRALPPQQPPAPRPPVRSPPRARAQLLGADRDPHAPAPAVRAAVQPEPGRRALRLLSSVDARRRWPRAGGVGRQARARAACAPRSMRTRAASAGAWAQGAPAAAGARRVPCTRPRQTRARRPPAPPPPRRARVVGA